MEEYIKLSENIKKLQTDVTQDLLSFGYLLGIILTIVGLVMLLYEIYLFYKIHSINSWPITKGGGTVRDSYMETTTSFTTYSIILVSSTQYTPTYRTRGSFIYSANGKSYLSDRISFYEPWESNAITAALEKELLRRNAKVDIRINPNNPSEAYIFNKPYDRYARLGFGLAIFLAGLYIIYKV